MHFYAAFMFAELSPWAEFEAKADGAAVKGIDHIVKIETEVIHCIKRTHLLDQNLSKISIDSPISIFVGFGQSVSRNSIADTTMIQSA